MGFNSGFKGLKRPIYVAF